MRKQPLTRSHVRRLSGWEWTRVALSALAAQLVLAWLLPPDEGSTQRHPATRRQPAT
jgi:hypothetical protein